MKPPLQLEVERKNAEALLQVERLFSDAIISSVPGILYLYDDQGKFQRWNRGFETVSGYSSEEILRMHPLDFFDGNDKLLLKERISEVFANGESSVEARLLTQQGHRIPFFFTGRRVLLDGVTCLVGMGVDITARKLAEARVAESEQKYRELVELANSIILRWNSKGNITFLNEFGQRFFGYSSQEIIGRHVMDAIVAPSGGSGGDLQGLIEQICADPEAFERNINENMCRDGKRVMISWTNRIVRDEQGQLTEILSIGTDITAQLRGEEMQLRLASIVESSDDAIAGKTLEGIITNWNPGAEKIFGYASSEAIGQPMLMLFPPERVNEEKILLDKIGRGESVTHFETVRVRKDGVRIHVSVTLSPIINTEGKIIGVSKIARDITIRKQHEMEIERLGRLYSALSLVNQAIVHSKSREELFQKVCRGLVEQGGFHMAWIGWHEPLSQTLVPAATWGDDENYLKAVQISTAQGPQGRGPSATSYCEDRIYISNDLLNDPCALPWRPQMEKCGYRSLAALPIRLENKVLGTLTIYATEEGFFHDKETALLGEVASDVSFALGNFVREEEIRTLNATLEHRVLDRTAELEAANKELEAFSYSVSHDLRAPLRAINGFAGRLTHDYSQSLPEEGRRCLERISLGGQRMGNLIDDLLAFSRLSRQQMDPIEVDNLTLIQSALEELKPQIEGRPIEIKIGCLPHSPGDSNLLKQVWLNLLSNAIKYSRGMTPAVIEIGCLEEGGENVYFVRDNGAGFDMKYANKLFGVFQRLHRAGEFEGTGVGLAIVQRIIHRHGGRIWASAEKGLGATFFFILRGEHKT